jgi:hypothetical protein
MGSSNSKADKIDNANKITECMNEEQIDNRNKTADITEEENSDNNEFDINSVIYISNTTKCSAKQPKRLLQYTIKNASEIKQSLEKKM